MRNLEKLKHNIELLYSSDYVFSPHYMSGIVFANLKSAKAMHDEGEDENAEGIKLFTSVLVAALYDCKIGETEFITKEMIEEFTTKLLPSFKLGEFAKFTLTILDHLDEGYSHDFMIGFCSALYANIDIAVREIEAEELL